MSLANPSAADFDARCDLAVRLLCEGQSEAYIAANIGVPQPQVRKWLRAAARSRAEEREEAIERHRLQLRYLTQRFLSQFSRFDEKKGETVLLPLKDRDVATLLRIQEREARLLGLDAPAKAELTHEFAGASLDELVREAQRLGIDTAAIAALPVGEVYDAEIEGSGDDSTPPHTNSSDAVDATTTD